MPETAIGLFPDVGGSFFLPRLENELGMYLGLTGERLKGADLLHAGVANFACLSERLPNLKEDLINLEDKSQLKSVLTRYTQEFGKEIKSDFSMANHLNKISSTFSKSSLEEIFAELQRNASTSEWDARILETLRKMSPLSLKVTFRQIREGQRLSSLAECLGMELRLVRRFCEDDDFYEGVRALLIDKDNAPKWNPPTLEAVTDAMVQRYFDPLPDGEKLEL